MSVNKPFVWRRRILNTGRLILVYQDDKVFCSWFQSSDKIEYFFAPLGTCTQFCENFVPKNDPFFNGVAVNQSVFRQFRRIFDNIIHIGVWEDKLC